MKPHIKDFFEFLEKKDNRLIPSLVKILNSDKFTITPKDLNIEGDLIFDETGGIEIFNDTEGIERVRQLPDGLKVKGNASFMESPITELPDDLHVFGNLFLTESGVNEIPNGLKVDGALSVFCPLSRMTEEEIRQEIERKGGYVKGKIEGAKDWYDANLPKYKQRI